MRWGGRIILIVLVILGLAGLFFQFGKGFYSIDDGLSKKVAKNSILLLPLDNVILNGKKFLKNLKAYREEANIKAVLIPINSPGGVVGPSQEIYHEILRTRTEFSKPVICVTSGLMASGAYYAGVACDKIVTSEGALVGSIGVIMQFANLEKLYDWAKVSRFSIISGKFKDSGAEYRSMREDERALFQDLIDETYLQFRAAIQKNRNLSDEVMDSYADGRVMTGNKAVELGFADKVGYYDDAVNEAKALAKLGDNFEIFEPPKEHHSFWDLGGKEEEDNVNSRAPAGLRSGVFNLFRELLGISPLQSSAELVGRPLAIMSQVL